MFMVAIVVLLLFERLVLFGEISWGIVTCWKALILARSMLKGLAEKVLFPE